MRTRAAGCMRCALEDRACFIGWSSDHFNNQHFIISLELKQTNNYMFQKHTHTHNNYMWVQCQNVCC